MVGSHQLVFAILGLILALISDSATAQNRRGQNRIPYKPAVTAVVESVIQRGDMSPLEAFPENFKWNQMTRVQNNRGYTLKKPQPCEAGSCYPATGNLLIGRESQLFASSTCGLRGPERYCIVSHLRERKKCFFCDANLPKQQHRVENIVHQYSARPEQDTWWQSENGLENVTLQLNLEAEFHFTHIIIKFKTFRPAAMFIERSYDFGATWQVYRYFAHNCEQSFPGVPTSPPRNLGDVVCESRYSNVAPSENGEIIFRVLSPAFQIDNPYSKEVQNLLKMTNLRINFTKLHTLGDDLLDNRSEIREKYYYAIKDVVVRGSCSCYGHASRCLPLTGTQSQQDMVHGRCECEHNTKGLNCHLCEDFYNDLPWKPAVGKQSNACRRCNCNNHADSCHFDQAVYERSGRVSGGVCDQCQHHTRGLNCEQCEPFFYHDVSRDISDPEACQPCDCDSAGSLDDGICDSRTDELSGDLSGRCHCKSNVEGRRCDRCKNGYWNFDHRNPDGCQACTCNTVGTIGNQGCNMVTGECTCKRYVTARDCNQCLPEFWGLSDDPFGCKPCECDIGGAYDNFCDVTNGQCRCRPNVGGRTCNQPEQSYYTGSIDLLVYEGENSRASSNCQVVIREPYRDGRNTTWTGQGFVRVFEGSTLTFNIDDIMKSMEYDIVVRYEPEIGGAWEDVQIIIERDGPVDADGPCADWRPSDDRLRLQLTPDRHSNVAIHNVCLESGKRYTVKLTFNAYNVRHETPSASILVDSIALIPRYDDLPFFTGGRPGEIRRGEFETYRCGDIFYDLHNRPQDINDVCKKYHYSIGTYVFEGAHACQCNPTGSHSLLCNQFGGRCSCKKNVVGRRCDACAPGTYNFGPEGCKPCDCDGVGALDNFCDVETGRCSCHPNTYSRTCGLCQPGFWNFPHCRRCECNGHADSCDSKTGACLNCRDDTTGHNCDMCVNNFYGDPRIGVDIPCRQCPCPGTIDSGHSYADSCSLDPVTEDVVCECYPGYGGPRCETCAENFFGNPEVPGGSCERCECSGNVDPSRPGNCDPRTGECLRCLYDTFGHHCEVCRPGFYGNALTQDCRDCQCDVLGSDRNAMACDHRTGQCPCQPHVVGQRCDRCEKNHWKIASGVGCEACECDPVGSASEKCNEYTGECECRPGFGGRRCNECQRYHWGNPNIHCQPCECDTRGSSTLQCDRDTGACVCHPGIGGEKCDHCDRGYIGYAPRCSPCGECFENWDATLEGLTNLTQSVIEDASRIQKVGTTGVYRTEFDQMEEKLRVVEGLVSNTSVKAQDLDELYDMAAEIDRDVRVSQAVLDELDNLGDSIKLRVNLADVTLKNMKERTNDLHREAESLKENATRLQEGNVQGALNVTLQMAEQSAEAERTASGTSLIVQDADRYDKNIENLKSKNTEAFERTKAQNNESLTQLGRKLAEFDALLPDMNNDMCGERVSGCGSLCGGAGCGFCGGLSCEGAVVKANQALDMATKQAAKIEQHKEDVDWQLSRMTQAKQDAIAARSNAQDAFNEAWNARNKSDKVSTSAIDLSDRIESFMYEDRTTPAMVRDLAEQALSKNINSRPDEIKYLASNISAIVGSLVNTERILADTAANLTLANDLRDRANQTKIQAEAKQIQAGKIVDLLNDAEKAQMNADQSINTAKEDIESSQKHLVAIVKDMKAARDTAGNITAKVESLDERLQRLRTERANTNYVLDTEIMGQADEVVREANLVANRTRKLGDDYRRADDSLTYKVTKSKGDIEKAKALLDRATLLTATTSAKSMDLDGMEDVYKDNERKLADLMAVVDSLTYEMNNHMRVIEEKSLIYRRCSA